MSRRMIGKAHLVAGSVAFVLIVLFWTSTVGVELFGSEGGIATAKTAILWGMLLLVPSMAVVGGSGFRLGGRSEAPIIAVKRRRMIVIAANGLLILVPSAVFLAWRASAGQFGAAFYVVQTLELAAGATNLTLMALNMRDGFALTRRRRELLQATSHRVSGR